MTIVTKNLKPRAGDGERLARVLDAVDANIVVLDSAGFIVGTNKGWRDFAASNPLIDGSLPRQIEAGANYLNACSAATGDASDNAMSVYEGIRAVIEGRKRNFSHEYPCHSPDKRRWFLMKVKPLPRSNPREVVVIHIDITDRHLAEINLLNKQRELNSALVELQAMAEKIKFSLAGQQFPASCARPLVPPTRQQGDADLVSSLSRREMEVLSGLIRGERNSTIAARLQLSTKSISTYRARIFEKLKVDSNVQLSSLVSRSGALK